MTQINKDYITNGGEVFEIFIDSTDDLPAEGIIDGRKAALGSSAIDVSTGTTYRINSSGEWINQSSGEKYVPDTPEPDPEPEPDPDPETDTDSDNTDEGGGE